MKWMEIIKLRIAQENPELIEQKIVKIINDVNNNGNKKTIKFYHHAMLDNDVSIFIHWESEKVEPQGSATGLCLFHVLKEYGLISHSVWVEGT